MRKTLLVALVATAILTPSLALADVSVRVNGKSYAKVYSKHHSVRVTRLAPYHTYYSGYTYYSGDYATVTRSSDAYAIVDAYPGVHVYVGRGGYVNVQVGW